MSIKEMFTKVIGKILSNVIETALFDNDDPYVDPYEKLSIIYDNKDHISEITGIETRAAAEELLHHIRYWYIDASRPVSAFTIYGLSCKKDLYEREEKLSKEMKEYKDPYFHCLCAYPSINYMNVKFDRKRNCCKIVFGRRSDDRT